MLSLSLLIGVFSGCQNKSQDAAAQITDENSVAVEQTAAPEPDTTDQTAVPASETANQTPAPPSQNGRANSEEMKKNMQESMNSLVLDGTINQAQADQILQALTSRDRIPTDQKKPESMQQDNQNNNQQSGQKNPAKGSRPDGQGRNPLSKLVSDGVITQAQADAVMKKTRENFTKAN